MTIKWLIRRDVMFEYIEEKRDDIRRGRDFNLITIGGMIASGKSTMTEFLAKELDMEPYYEKVDDNDILPLFYMASKEEQEKKRYPFLLQLDFLNSRFEIIKSALLSDRDVVMDRSIYEDWYFAKVNNEIGDISNQEFKIYEKLLNNMMQELDELPKKSPDLMIYLKISFEETMKRIGIRGRDFEQDEGLYDYYYELWKGYDDWVYSIYDKSNILVVDMDEIDISNNDEDKKLVLNEVKKVLEEL